MKCPDCNGRGDHLDDFTIGTRSCDTCGGSGEVDVCPTCDGSGEVLNETTAYTERCDRCGGKGYIS
jgi:DnaJ-class molecular chaperone